MPVAQHPRVLAPQRFELLLDRGLGKLAFLQVFDRAALRIEAVAVSGDEFALREIAIDQRAGLDRGCARAVGARFILAAEDEHRTGDERHAADPGKQQLLALRDRAVEVAPGFAARLVLWRWRGRIACVGIGHYSSPPLVKTRKA